MPITTRFLPLRNATRGEPSYCKQMASAKTVNLCRQASNLLLGHLTRLNPAAFSPEGSDLAI
jgi:hypothetical protein